MSRVSREQRCSTIGPIILVSPRKVSRIHRIVGVLSGNSAIPVNAIRISGPPGMGGQTICNCFGLMSLVILPFSVTLLSADCQIPSGRIIVMIIVMLMRFL